MIMIMIMIMMMVVMVMVMVMVMVVMVVVVVVVMFLMMVLVLVLVLLVVVAVVVAAAAAADADDDADDDDDDDDDDEYEYDVFVFVLGRWNHQPEVQSHGFVSLIIRSFTWSSRWSAIFCCTKDKPASLYAATKKAKLGWRIMAWICVNCQRNAAVHIDSWWFIVVNSGQYWLVVVHRWSIMVILFYW